MELTPILPAAPVAVATAPEVVAEVLEEGPGKAGEPLVELGSGWSSVLLGFRTLGPG